MKGANTAIYANRTIGNWTATHPAIGRSRNRPLAGTQAGKCPNPPIHAASGARWSWRYTPVVALLGPRQSGTSTLPAADRRILAVPLSTLWTP